MPGVKNPMCNTFPRIGKTHFCYDYTVNKYLLSTQAEINSVSQNMRQYFPDIRTF